MTTEEKAQLVVGILPIDLLGRDGVLEAPSGHGSINEEEKLCAKS